MVKESVIWPFNGKRTKCTMLFFDRGVLGWIGTSVLFQDPVSLVITAFYHHLRWELSKITSCDSFFLVASCWSIQVFLLYWILYQSNNIPMSPILLRNKCLSDSWPIKYFEQQKTCFSMLFQKICFDVYYWQIYCCQLWNYGLIFLY